jgi:hypothetical protein
MGIWGRGRLRNSVGIETKYDHFTPPGAPGATKIYITFHLDAHGSLRVSAKNYGTGRDLPVVRS